MKINLLILCTMIAAAAIYGHLETHRSLPASQVPLAPAFSFTDIEGRKQALGDFAGKTVVLNFWASWCAPCIVEFPQMLGLARETAGSHVFIFLSIDEDQDAVRRFAQKHRLNVPENALIGLDREKQIAARYGTTKIPETYVIAPDGKLRDKIIGAVDWNAPEIRKKLSADRT